jgi:hypothetical protein
MGRSIAYAGSSFTIAFATCADGSQPALEFYKNELDDVGRAKMLTLFRYLGDQGRIANHEKFKKVGNDLWEFKSHQIRMLCAFSEDRTVVLANGFIKKGDKIPPRHLVRATRILQEDANRCAKEKHQTRQTKWQN